MGMTYSESAKGVMITAKRAFSDLRRHGMVSDDFDMFDHEVKPNADNMYDAGDVMDWLGY